MLSRQRQAPPAHALDLDGHGGPGRRGTGVSRQRPGFRSQQAIQYFGNAGYIHDEARIKGSRGFVRWSRPLTAAS